MKNFAETVLSGLILLGITLLIIALSIIAILISAILPTIFWNISMPSLFGLNAIAWWQTAVIICAVSSIKESYQQEIKLVYERNDNIGETEKAILILIVTLIIMFIGILALQYSWNVIIPSLLNIEFVKINFLQAIGIWGIARVILANNMQVKSNETNDNSINNTLYSSNYRIVRNNGFEKDEEIIEEPEEIIEKVENND